MRSLSERATNSVQFIARRHSVGTIQRGAVAVQAPQRPCAENCRLVVVNRATRLVYSAPRAPRCTVQGRCTVPLARLLHRQGGEPPKGLPRRCTARGAETELSKLFAVRGQGKKAPKTAQDAFSPPGGCLDACPAAGRVLARPSEHRTSAHLLYIGADGRSDRVLAPYNAVQWRCSGGAGAVVMSVQKIARRKLHDEAHRHE